MASNFEFKSNRRGPDLFSFATAYNRILRKFSRSAGLYSGQPRVLTILVDKGGCTLSELSELTGTGMPSLSVSIRNMRKCGLIEDGAKRSRNKILYPTEEGVRKATLFHEEYDALAVRMTEHFGEERIVEMAQMFEQLTEFFEKECE